MTTLNSDNMKWNQQLVAKGNEKSLERYFVRRGSEIAQSAKNVEFFK